MVRHRAERVLNSEVPYVWCLDRSDREDVELHQPRCANASAYGLRGLIRLRRIYNFLLFHANIIQLSYTFGNFLYYFWD